MVEGSSNENPSPIVNPNLNQDEAQEQRSTITGLMEALHVIYANSRDAMKEMEKKQENTRL